MKSNTPSGLKLLRLALAAMFLALALVLPFLTGQIPQIGGALCPMHFPVLLCGFFCGPWYGLAVGLVAPLLRFFLFGMPPLVPTGLAMCFELAAYGFAAGLLYRLLPRKRGYVYLALAAAMCFGRLVWGAAQTVILGLGGSAFGWKAFLAGAFVNAAPGIALQLILIPPTVMIVEKYFPRLREK